MIPPTSDRVLLLLRRVAPIFRTSVVLGLLILAACGDAAAPKSPPETAPTTRPPVLQPRAIAAERPAAPATTEAATPAVAPASDAPAFVQVAAGENHTCALLNSGSVQCWGDNGDGQLDVPEGASFRQVTAGYRFSCGIRVGGGVTCWGQNDRGQLDAPDGQFTAIDAGWDHVCALSDGIATCWGWNANERATPPPDVQFTAIGAGAEHSCGLTTDGDLVCWGKNDNEQADSRAGPFRALAVGIAHTCVLAGDGTAVCQGENSAGQSEPPATAFVQISAGSDHTCGILATGHIECWGGRKVEAESVPFGPPGQFDSVSAGWSGACAANRDGQAVCWPAAAQRQPPEPYNRLQFVNVFPGASFSEPVEAFPWPPGGLAVVDKKGSIVALTAEQRIDQILDLTDIVDLDGPENGMLSVAIDPQFEEYQYIYIYYTPRHEIEQDKVVARLSRFPVVDGQAVREQELTILDNIRDAKVDGHYGGAIRFGPDGMLYLSIGDAYCFECPQSLETLHGKIIRIDIRGASVDAPYKAPDDNPRWNTPKARPEIWAYGLRNPWRMAFDSQDGSLWVGDVGQHNYEEVSIPAAGVNLGWPIKEGPHCFELDEKTREEYDVSIELPCQADNRFTEPIISYEHTGNCAIVGGIVYRGAAIPWLQGTYLFGDHCSGKIWALDGDAESGWRMIEIADLDWPVPSFGTDADGEVLVLTFTGPMFRPVETEPDYAPSVSHTPLSTTVVTPS